MLRRRRSNAVHMKCSKPNITRSTTRIVSSYGPQKAVSSCSRRLPGSAVLCQNDESRCSVRESIRGRRTVPQALSLYIQVKFSPVILDPTRFQTCDDPTYSLQMAVSSNLPCFPREMRRGVLDMLRRRRSNTVSMKCSTTNVDSRTNTRSSFTQPQDQSNFGYPPVALAKCRRREAGVRKTTRKSRCTTHLDQDTWMEWDTIHSVQKQVDDDAPTITV
jgi:hypothetical protein